MVDTNPVVGNNLATSVGGHASSLRTGSVGGRVSIKSPTTNRARPGAKSYTIETNAPTPGSRSGSKFS